MAQVLLVARGGKGPTMLFKTPFKWILSRFKGIVGAGTVVSKAGSINPLLSSSAISWSFCSHSALSSRAQ